MTDTAQVPPDQRQIWESWHHTHSFASPSGHADAELETFVKSLPAQGARVRILEVGCGQGRDAINLARRDYEVIAFDLSPTAIRIAKANALSAGVKIDFSIRDAARRLPYRNDVFDGIFAHLSLHYFDDFTTHSVFVELARVLKPGGILYFTVRSVNDHFYRKGEQIDTNLYCFEGHIRGFFDIDYTQALLKNWEIHACEYYEVVAKRLENPGKFLRVIAALPR
jgi:SAM-dependent methyltransferase